MARRAKGPATPPNDVLVPVDPSLKKRWTTLAARVDALAGKDTRAWDELWEAAGEIVDSEPPLFLFGGYKNAAEFFVERMKVDRATGYRSVRVARYASPAEELRYGVAKLDAALSFIEAKLGPLTKPPLPIAFDRLKFTVGKGKNARTLTFDEATAADIKSATRTLSAAPARGTSKVAAAFGKSFADSEALADIRVTERGGLVSFVRVPLASIGRFASAIGRTKLPR